MAMIVDAFAGKLLERLTNIIDEKAMLVLGVKDELQRLRRRMERIARVLKDAEKRRIQDETVKGWVNELKDLMYDADDIIDLCIIQGTGLLQQQNDDDHHHSLPAESSATAFSSTIRVRCCNFLSCVRSVPFRYEIADQIKSLNDRLTEISEDKDKFHFISNSSSKSNHDDDAYVMNYEASYHQSSSLPESDIVGWDIRDATNNLVELLVSQHEQKCRLFAVVGMGGIGKTTLAQLIYNDSKINVGFMLCSWICISKFYTSANDLLKELVRNMGVTYGEMTTIAELRKLFCDVLQGKSLFLVLDDVWDADIWIDLMKNMIERTTAKCRVLVTTRDRNVAIKMGAVHIHNVSKLPLNFGWELLCRKVFTNNDQKEIEKMKVIGMQIVQKCDGLPIAIKAIAGVLITKDQSERQWRDVLNSAAWTITGLPEELRGALYLSYEALPSALKQCFLYCGLNPHDRDLYYEHLVCEWIAEGFIQPNGNESMEDVARGYYMDLIRRSLLQPYPDYVDTGKCTMNDLLRALAMFLVGDESFSGDPQAVVQSNNSMIKLRRLTISSDRESVSIPPHLDRLRNLRLWTPPNFDIQTIGSLKQLRILVLNGDRIENIPDNIVDLVHLKLLDLEHTKICELPESLGNLINLQFLLLGNCKSLHILPKTMTRLCNLRRLNLEGTPVNYLPKGIGKLEHLNHVTGFIVEDMTSGSGEGGDCGCNLEELELLKNLSHLGIDKLEKASKTTSLLLNKPCLKSVHLRCTLNSGGCKQQQEMDKKIVQVFDDLCPPPGLEKLVIENFFGDQFPKWMSSSSISATLPELTELELLNCANRPQLPELGQLPYLNYLKVYNATAVVSIGPEFLGSQQLAASAFPKLKFLILSSMTSLEEWSLINEEEDNNENESSKPLLFPSLKKLVIQSCPKLKGLPRGLNQASIQKLIIEGALSLSRISHLPALRELNIEDCPMLKCVEKLESLQSLKITDEENNILPKWLITFLQQRMEHHDNQFHLHLKCSAEALKGCLKGRPYWVFLQHVPRLEAYADGGSMYLKYTKEPFSYQTNLDENTTGGMAGRHVLH